MWSVVCGAEPPLTFVLWPDVGARIAIPTQAVVRAVPAGADFTANGTADDFRRCARDLVRCFRRAHRHRIGGRLDPWGRVREIARHAIPQRRHTRTVVDAVAGPSSRVGEPAHEVFANLPGRRTRHSVSDPRAPRRGAAAPTARRSGRATRCAATAARSGRTSAGDATASARTTGALLFIGRFRAADEHRTLRQHRQSTEDPPESHVVLRNF